MPIHLNKFVQWAQFADSELDDLDKKLLLTIQSVCNAEGVKIPWDKVARIMGAHMTDGAVIQHLAKLRIRMLEQNLDVPPPLRRGGGTAVSTSNGGKASGRSKSAPSKAVKPSSKKGQTELEADNDEENEFDVDDASDPEEEFGQARFKRSKRDSKQTAIKAEETEEVFVKPNKEGNKRKRRSSASEAEKGKKEKFLKKKDNALIEEMIATQTNLGGRTKKPTLNYDEEKNPSDNDTQYNSEIEDSGQDFEGVQHVASGADFLYFESGSDSEKVKKQPVQGRSMVQQETKNPSKIIVLPLPGSRKNTENYPDTPDPIVDLETDSVNAEDQDIEMESQAAANRFPTPSLGTVDTPLNEQTMVTGPEVAYDNSSSGMFGSFGPSTPAEGMYQSNQTLDGNESLFEQNFYPNDLDQGFIVNQDFDPYDHSYGSSHNMPVHNAMGPTDVRYPLPGQDWNISVNTQPTSRVFGPGSSNHMYQSQGSSIPPGTPMNSFGTPAFGVRGTASNHGFPDFRGDLGSRQYGTDNNEHMRPIPDIPSLSGPSRPSVVTRQANQPSVSGDPFSATSTNNNPTPIVASAGDAGLIPALDYAGTFFGAEFDDSCKIPMDMDTLDAEWEHS